MVHKSPSLPRVTDVCYIKRGKVPGVTICSVLGILYLAFKQAVGLCVGLVEFELQLMTIQAPFVFRANFLNVLGYSIDGRDAKEVLVTWLKYKAAMADKRNFPLG